MANIGTITSQNRGTQTSVPGDMEAASQRLFQLLNRHDGDRPAAIATHAFSVSEARAIAQMIEGGGYVDAKYKTDWGYHVPKGLSGLSATIDVFCDDSKIDGIFLSVGGSHGRVIGEGGEKKVYACLNYSTGEPCALLKALGPPYERHNRSVAKDTSVWHAMDSWGTGIVVRGGMYPSRKRSGEPRAREILPYALGGDLFQYMREGGRKNLGVEDAVNVALQLTNGLKKFHESGRAHRDIKADNVLNFRKDGVNNFQIVDFGFTQEAGESIPLVGTPEYFCPRSIERILTGERTLSFEEAKKLDIYALGCVFFNMISGDFHPNQSRMKSLYVAAKPEASDLEYLDHVKNNWTLTKEKTLLMYKSGSHIQLYYDVVFNMMDPDPSKRPSLDQVLGSMQEIKSRQAPSNSGSSNGSVTPGSP